jgi:hypothetical protein
VDFPYLITCRHAIANISEPPGAHIRVNRLVGKPPLVIQTTQSEWIGHPDDSVDICAYPFSLRKWDREEDLEVGRFKLESPDTIERVSKHYGLDLGAEVFIIGAFVGQIGQRKNIPIVRTANIAAMPDEPISPYSKRRPAYLVETRSLGGVSGSPMFLHTESGRLHGGARPGWRTSGSDVITMPYVLIGMIIAHHTGNYRSDFGTVDPEDKDVIPGQDADFNAGISVAVPVNQIIETLDQPSLQLARDAAVLERRQKACENSSD